MRMLGDSEARGWFSVVSGVVLFAVGIASLLDPDASKIYVGAILCGPPMALFGIMRLQRYYRFRATQAFQELSEPALTAADLYDTVMQEGIGPNDVTCDACGHEYVYFPAKAAAARAAHLGPEAAAVKGLEALLCNCAVAPCPLCGRIQPGMFAQARQFGPTSPQMYVGLSLLFLSVGLFLFTMFGVVTPAMAHQRPASDANKYWVAITAILVPGICVTIWGWMRDRRWDPNSQSAEIRLRLAHQVSLSREAYEEMLEPEDDPRGADGPDILTE